MTLRTGFYFDPISLQHDTGRHPENAGRLQFLMDALRTNGTLKAFREMPSRKADFREIERIHELDYIRSVEAACAEGVRYLGTKDCLLSRQTFEAARCATGMVLEAVDQVADEKLDNAFCAVRPPGHHAEYDQALGFCYFNNVAIAAEFLIRERGYRRVLIFDFDVHHGNGTQHTFEERNDVFFCSIHQDPHTCYPGTGYANERGRSGGKGFTLNCPMPPYSENEAYHQIFVHKILPAFREYRPDFIILSAGFDAHRDDPLAQEMLTVEGFNGMLNEMKDLAHQFAGGRMVSVLEGGYHYQALAECIQSHLEILIENPS